MGCLQGSAMVITVARLAAAAGCRRCWMLTTNDNVDALRFYQRRGFRLTAIRCGAVDQARRTLKPQIPVIGNYGIPIRDEIELAQDLPLPQPSDRRIRYPLLRRSARSCHRPDVRNVTHRHQRPRPHGRAEMTARGVEFAAATRTAAVCSVAQSGQTRGPPSARSIPVLDGPAWAQFGWLMPAPEEGGPRRRVHPRRPAVDATAPTHPAGP
jgi:hypothetical protein